MVAIDDEQWLDSASARVLGFALCRLRDEPVAVVLARRTNGDTPLWLALAKEVLSGALSSLYTVENSRAWGTFEDTFYAASRVSRRRD